MSGKFESFNWLRGVADDYKRISILHRIILMRICLHRNGNTGKCEPGYQLVADEVGVYRSTIIRAVESGVRCGWLAPPTRGRRANANLVLTFPMGTQEVASESDFKAQPRRRSRERLQDTQEVVSRSDFKAPRSRSKGQLQDNNQEVALEPSRSRLKATKKSLNEKGSRAKSKGSTPQREKNGIERGKKRAPGPRNSVGERTKEEASAIADGFARFWSAYPRKVNEDDARNAFAAAIAAGADIEIVISSATTYAIVRAAAIDGGDDPKWTLYPATWLKKRKWKDPPPPGLIIDQGGNPVAVETETEDDDDDDDIVARVVAMAKAAGASY
jgi:hypothetical protein